jgi:hypothetical protein
MEGEDGGDDLTEKLHPWFEAEDVIEEPSGERDENGRQESPNAGKGGDNGGRAPERRVDEEDERDRAASQDGDTAGAGNRGPVDLAGTGPV